MPQPSTDPARPGSRPSGLRAVAADPQFRCLWLNGTVAGTVRWLDLLAVGVYTLQQTGSALTVALMIIARWGPLFFFGLVAGALAERMNRRTLLLIGNGAMMLTSATLALLAWLEAITLWHIALGAFLNGLFWASDNSVRRSMIGEVVPLDRLGTAMGLDATTNNGTRALGPLMGGALLDAVGLQGAFLLGACLYAIGFLAALALRYSPPDSRGTPSNVLKNMMEGLRHARGSRIMVGTLLITMIVNLFGFPYSSMVPVIGAETLLLGATLIGVLASSEGFGAVLGALAVAVLARPEHHTRIYLFGSVGFVGGILVFALAPGFWTGALALFLAGFGIAGFGTMQATLLLTAAQPAMRSRVMGLLTMSIGAGPLGFLYVGWLAEQQGAAFALVAMALKGLLLLGLAGAVWPEFLRRGAIRPD